MPKLTIYPNSITRWMGQSPGGMNATGDADMDNYVLMLEAKRNEWLPDQLKSLDLVMAKHCGLDEVPEYSFPSLREQGAKPEAETMKLQVESIGMALDKFIITEDEARDILRQISDPFSDLEGDAPTPEPPDLMGNEQNPMTAE